MEIHSESDKVRNFIFPLCAVELQHTEKSIVYKELLGTGFFIGNNGFAITAKHVVTKVPPHLEIIGLLTEPNKVTGGSKWKPLQFEYINHHPIEDVSILKAKGKYSSFIFPTNSWEGSSQHYMLWGYPEVNSHSFHKHINGGLIPVQRPDLCYHEGYIIRRISNENEIIKGKNFFEIQQHLSGCSGAPLIKKPEPANLDKTWKMMGVYVANIGRSINNFTFKNFLDEAGYLSSSSYQDLIKDERINKLINLFDKYSSSMIEPLKYGLAVREDGIRDWLNAIDPDLYK